MSGTGDLEPRLDHLVYAVTDLEAAVAEFAERTGVSPVEGGRHLGRGTRNHLVGLGPTSYLEIIGPDRDNPPEPATAVPFGLDRLTAPKLVTWAVRPADIEAAVVYKRQLLEWRLASTHPAPLAGITPFLIDWGDTPHPASTGLPRVELAALHATHPDPAAVRRVSDALGITLDVTAGPVGLRAVLVTPRGTVTLD